ncbi:MAG: acyltransferase family protein, partial [Paludibacteraceae bacterium]|nr:acyltransferase family protein [Paludibacteraceae bacterium]
MAKGISICLVMLFHIKGIKDVSYDPIVESVLFSSCMVPPFFFIAGTFFREGDRFRKFLIKKVNSLLVPFVFFYLMSAVIIPNLTHQLFGMNY